MEVKLWIVGQADDDLVARGTNGAHQPTVVHYILAAREALKTHLSASKQRVPTLNVTQHPDTASSHSKDHVRFQKGTIRYWENSPNAL